MFDENEVRWLGWLLFAESLILLLALAGPGRSRGLRHTGDHALIAGWFLSDPSLLETVAVKFLVANVFIGAALLVAWVEIEMIIGLDRLYRRRLSLGLAMLAFLGVRAELGDGTPRTLDQQIAT